MRLGVGCKKGGGNCMAHAVQRSSDCSFNSRPEHDTRLTQRRIPTRSRSLFHYRSGVGKMAWLIDFVGYSMRNAPSVRTSIEVLHTLQVRGS